MTAPTRNVPGSRRCGPAPRRARRSRRSRGPPLPGGPPGGRLLCGALVGGEPGQPVRLAPPLIEPLQRGQSHRGSAPGRPGRVAGRLRLRHPGAGDAHRPGQRLVPAPRAQEVAQSRWVRRPPRPCREGRPRRWRRRTRERPLEHAARGPLGVRGCREAAAAGLLLDAADPQQRVQARTYGRSCRHRQGVQRAPADRGVGDVVDPLPQEGVDRLGRGQGAVDERVRRRARRRRSRPGPWRRGGRRAAGAARWRRPAARGW